MNTSTLETINKFCKATGAPRKLIKRLIAETPVHERARALHALKQGTAQTNAGTPPAIVAEMLKEKES